MGCCCSCLERGGSTRTETEMSSQNNGGQNGTGGKLLSFARTMTQPTISIKPGGAKISGHGLAVVGAALEQDAGYWEFHIHQIPEGAEVMFGVTHKKNRAFYNELGKNSKGDPEFNGRSMMKHFKVKTDDTVGVAVQQSDLPMVQFLLNGEPLHEHAINRFRGLVYPAIYLPESDEEIQIELVMHEDGFRQMAPHARFGPIIVARGLI